MKRNNKLLISCINNMHNWMYKFVVTYWFLICNSLIFITNVFLRFKCLNCISGGDIFTLFINLLILLSCLIEIHTFYVDKSLLVIMNLCLLCKISFYDVCMYIKCKVHAYKKIVFKFHDTNSIANSH